ncbi:MAG: ABC transporter substrate-binding protein, partial [Acidimicrobiales bacterium]|nr:ABC transporter substrate-binding protein [Acidimicrobiales bacterium]
GNKQSDTASGGGAGGTGNNDGSKGTAASGTFTISTSDCDYQPTVGITDSEIKIGSSFPQAGLYSAFAEISKGWKAYFDYVNDQGGINGKKITIVTKNDDYESAKTKTNAQELIDKDKVFALFNLVGTPNNLGIRSDMNEACVPNLFAATGSQLLGNPEKYPWTIGSIPSYATEAATFAEYLKKNKPNAKVGILRQNDDFGEGYADAFKKAIEGSNVTLVGEETYQPGETNVTSQITKLNSAGADALLLAVTTLTCPNAMTAVKGIQGWDPLTYVSATCASKVLIGAAGDAAIGVLTSVYLKDPLNPKWADDAGVKEYKEIGSKYGLTDKDFENGVVEYGWVAGQMLVETLKKATALDRKSVMERAYTLDMSSPQLLPGVAVKTDGVADPYPIESLQIGKWQGQYFELQGEVIDYEGKTNQFVPKKS